MRRFVFLLALLLPLAASAQPLGDAPVGRLYAGWTVRSADGRVGPLPMAVPGTIHPALVRAGTISDPLFGANEQAAAWVDTTTWVVETTFDAPPMGDPWLVFDGIDTYADVFLNDAPLFSARNAFRPHEANVRGRLRPTGNRLVVRFRPTVREAEAAARAYPIRLPESPRVFARTPQYRFGWDWGPRLVGAGLPRPVRLEDRARLHATGLHADVQRLTNDRADVSVRTIVRTRAPGPATVRVALGGRTVATRRVALRAGDNAVAVPVVVRNPVRWEPANSGRPGAPHRYRLSVTVEQGGEVWSHTQTLGLRTVRVDRTGGGFTFVVNGRPVYAKGANVVPMTLFYPATRERIEQVLGAAIDAGMNTVRVWGGGVYEDDVFYDVADSLGLMVWQDFMFSSAFYPSDNAFLDEVRQEAGYNVQRLRRHPSVVLWCGGNEVREGWFNWGWQRQLGYSAQDSVHAWRGYERLFEGVLAEAVARHAGGVPYWPNSPSHGWGRDVAYREGDVHFWGVWWGRMPFEAYRRRVGRFNSEYGMQAYPVWKTVETFADTLSEANPAFRNHQKHPTGFETLRHYALQTFGRGDTLGLDALRQNDLPAYAFLTQAMQAEGIGMALEAHRANAPRTGGSLYWQLNDVWPVVSWASVDHFGRTKPLHYRARVLNRTVAPVADSTGIVRIATDSVRAARLMVQVDVWDGATGVETPQWGVSTAVKTVRAPSGPASTAVPGLRLAAGQVARVRVTDANGRTLADTRVLRDGAWRLPMYDPGLRWTVDGRALVFTADRPALGVWVETAEGVNLSVNYIDVWPGEARRLVLPPGVDPARVRVRSLHDLCLR